MRSLPRCRAERLIRKSLLCAPPLLWGCLALAGCGSGSSPASRATLTILGTTDVHGHLLPYDYATDGPARGSLAQVATLVDSIRRTDPAVLLLDSGDLLQGTPLDEYQARVLEDSVHPVIAAMNYLGYAASAVGNHEYNYGTTFLARTLSRAAFPFLAANIYRADTDSLVYAPYVVLRLGELKIGVIGFTTPGVAIWDRANVQRKQRFEDIVASARRWLPRLKAEGPDVVVAVAHSGLGPGSSYTNDGSVPEENAVARLAREVPGIDVIFAGHTHVRIDGEHIGGALVLEAGRFADALAVVHLTFERKGGRWRLSHSDGTTIDTGDARPDSALTALVRPAHERTLAWLREPIGTTPDRWSATDARFRDQPIADLITEVEREVSGADLASTAVFAPRAGFGPGPISRRDVLGLYIYPNTLKAVRIDGTALKAYLEWSARYYRSFPAPELVNDSVPGYNFDIVSGVEYTIDLRQPVGKRVTTLRYHGHEVTAADTFTLALNNYRQAGGGGAAMLAGAPLAYSGERAISQLIIDYIRNKDTLRAADVFQPNWKLLPPEAVRRLATTEAASAHH